jgi:hypothetical protein
MRGRRQPGTVSWGQRRGWGDAGGKVGAVASMWDQSYLEDRHGHTHLSGSMHRCPKIGPRRHQERTVGLDGYARWGLFFGSVCPRGTEWTETDHLGSPAGYALKKNLATLPTTMGQRETKRTWRYILSLEWVSR